MDATRRRRRAAIKRPVAVLGLAAMVGAFAACTPGAYTLDIFREMHYQPSQKHQEPNRLAPPAGAVPADPRINPLKESTGISLAGRSPAITFEQAGPLTNPVPANDTTRTEGDRL